MLNVITLPKDSPPFLLNFPYSIDIPESLKYFRTFFFKNLDKSLYKRRVAFDNDIEKKPQNTLSIYIFNFFNTYLIGYIAYPVPDTKNKEMAKTESCFSQCVESGRRNETQK